MNCRRLAVFLLVLPLGPSAVAGPAPFDPTDHYERRTVEGWPVLINKSLLADQPDLARDALTLLGQQLYQIKRHVPAASVSKLQTVRLWIEEAEPHHPCMAYHPDPSWLSDHDMNPEKARGVEVANARNFLKWTREQPWMVLHELAHAYHHQFLDGGFENLKIAEAYREAVAAKTYATVLHYDGNEVKAYAATNPMEYFAEASEAFFGSNDFYPFVRAELRRHDPKAHDLLANAWGTRRP